MLCYETAKSREVGGHRGNTHHCTLERGEGERKGRGEGRGRGVQNDIFSKLFGQKLSELVVPRHENSASVKSARLTTLRGQVLAIGGSDQWRGGTPTGAIHQYNRSTNSWSVIGEMPTPRAHPLVAVLPSHKLIVVGGLNCAVTEIASSTY